ncbi:hypothetical protein JW905_01515 [bacterium]|nr:hypothetical protein [candidate division CSSED10-310 bacterium]
MARSLWQRITNRDHLANAWFQVRDKSDTPGIDQVTVEAFENDLEANLDELSSQLAAKSYSPLPIKTFEHKVTATKIRTLGISCLRDRVVQQAILNILSPVFEKHLSPIAYAYRRNRSALMAADIIQIAVRDGLLWVLRTDIQNFFDTIDHAFLMDILQVHLTDADVLDLLRTFIKGRLLDHWGYHDPVAGIVQGNILSPLLSNIYLMEFDSTLVRKGVKGVRYSDDMAFAAATKEELEDLLAHIQAELTVLNLALNEGKTMLRHANQGFTFLGFYFDNAGRGPSAKALEVIRWRLSEVKREDSTTCLERYEAYTEVLRGWLSYFRSLQGLEPENAEQYAAMLDLSLGLGGGLPVVLLNYHNLFLDAPAELQQSISRGIMAHGFKAYACARLAELAAVDTGVDPTSNPELNMGLSHVEWRGLTDRFRSSSPPRAAEFYLDVAQWCAEQNLFELGQAFDEMAKMVLTVSPSDAMETLVSPEGGILRATTEHLEQFRRCFAGREHAHGVERTNDLGQRIYVPVDRGISNRLLRRHIAGEITVGLYLIRADNAVSTMVVDIDIARKEVVTNSPESTEFSRLLQAAHDYAVVVLDTAGEMGLKGFLVDSGHRGRHVWFILEDPIPAATARLWLQKLFGTVSAPPEGLTREFFPDQDQAPAGRHGCLVKLPLGYHTKSHRRSVFLTREGVPAVDQLAFLMALPVNRGDQVRKALDDAGFASGGPPKRIMRKAAAVPKSLAGVMDNCHVVRFLVNKAKDTSYLTHRERMILLYVFGFLGDDGRAYLHVVMGYCVNYRQEITQRYISNMMTNPVSCAKVRETMGPIAAAVGCNCHFKQLRGYPAPVWHSEEYRETHRPRSRSTRDEEDTPEVTKDSTANASAVEPEEESEVKTPAVTLADSRVGELVLRLIRLSRQERDVVKKKVRYHDELRKLFQAAGVEEWETEHGVLRRAVEEGEERWIIQV